jgi:hypothetical protein
LYVANCLADERPTGVRQFDQVQALLAADTLNVIGGSQARFDIAAPAAHKMLAAKPGAGKKPEG